MKTFVHKNTDLMGIFVNMYKCIISILTNKFFRFIENSKNYYNMLWYHISTNDIFKKICMSFITCVYSVAIGLFIWKMKRIFIKRFKLIVIKVKSWINTPDESHHSNTPDESHHSNTPDNFEDIKNQNNSCELNIADDCVENKDDSQDDTQKEDYEKCVIDEDNPELLLFEDENDF